jgi:hypothetical protein
MARPPKTPSDGDSSTPTPPRRRAASRKSTSTPTPSPAPAASSEGGETPSEAPKRGRPRKSAASSAPTAPAVKSPPKRSRSTGAASSRKAPAKRTRTASATSTAKRAVTNSAPAKLVTDTRDKMGDRNFFAALIGGVAAFGAALTGIILATRKTGLASDATEPTSAHQPDGTDSTASFNAGIADEGTIPEAHPS